MAPSSGSCPLALAVAPPPAPLAALPRHARSGRGGSVHGLSRVINVSCFNHNGPLFWKIKIIFDQEDMLANCLLLITSAWAWVYNCRGTRVVFPPLVLNTLFINEEREQECALFLRQPWNLEILEFDKRIRNGWPTECWGERINSKWIVTKSGIQSTYYTFCCGDADGADNSCSELPKGEL